MSSTPKTARRAILMTTLTCALVAPLALSAAAEGARGSTQRPARSTLCANVLCTRDRPHVPSCWRFARRERIARCFVARAATHYRQSRSLALSIAWRESRLNWRVTNRSSGAAGLFQFMPGTWAHTPYRRYSPYNPRWAALAAMWMWSRGGYRHWSL